MPFLEEFDRRADAQAAGRKPDEPVPENESPENRELLDFADLVRARRAVPTDSERERALERVREAQTPSPGAGEERGGGAGLPLRRNWLPFAVAALLALTAGLTFLFCPPGGTGKTVVQKDGDKPGAKGVTLVADVGQRATGSNRPPNAEFANLAFPKPKLREGDGATAVETKTGANVARLTRVHGLVIFQPKGEKRWRVAARGQALQFGDTIRTSKRLDSSVRILAPDGSAVSIGAGSTIVYGVSRDMGRLTDPEAAMKHMPPNPRAWSLNAGAACFEVASSQFPFLVEAPHAVARALGTRFELSVTPAGTLCSVSEGKVELVLSYNAAPVPVAAGQAALTDGQKVQKSNEKSAVTWLKILEAEAASDYGIGELVAKAEKANEHLPLEIKSHTVTVTVVDQVARTFVDEVFINNSDRRLEGTFYYPLPPDASISEFAMYVGDQRIVGEVLEQQRARQIFEYIVRQQRDPALLEYAGGNLFKMRVFPIEPHSEKRIQLGYTQILPRSSGKVTYTYPLYSEKLIKNPLHDLKIEFRVISSPGLSDLTSPTHQAPSAISDDGKRGALAFRARKYSPTRDFTVTYAVPDGAECVAFSNKRPDDPDGYFMLQLCPKVQLPRRDPPRRLLVIVDGSASAGAQEYAVATEFAASAADVSGDWQFGVLRGGQKPQTFGALAYADTDTSTKVRDFLQKSQPLGATDLLETFRQAAASIKADEGIQIVYVGDGIDTVGELSGPALAKEIAALFKGKDVKLSTVAVGSSYDRPVLQSIAAKLGGTFSRVEGAADVHAAVGQVLESFYRPLLWDVMVNFEEVAVRAVYPEFLGTVAAGDTAVVLGRFNEAKGVKGRVKVVADQGGQLVERGYNIDLSADEAANRFLPRLWAKAHIDALLATMGLGSATGDARTKQDIIKTSIDYQIMSPFTAFLVLESEEDYARFGIKRTMRKWDWTGNLTGLPDAQNVLVGAGTVPFTGNVKSQLGQNKEILFWNEGVDTISGNDSGGVAAPSSGPVGATEKLVRLETPSPSDGGDEADVVSSFDGDVELEAGERTRFKERSQLALSAHEPPTFGLEDQYAGFGDHFETTREFAESGDHFETVRPAEKRFLGGGLRSEELAKDGALF
ncbi:MAG: VIT domain-containing protein [Planctomycetota bacterium]|nr:VIT domain-containing protein [Planctomycetota bacterium]